MKNFSLNREINRHQKGEFGLVHRQFFRHAWTDAVQQRLNRVLISRMLSLSMFPPVLQFFKRFPALFTDVRSRCFVRPHVTLIVTLPDEFLTTLMAIELETAFVSCHVGTQRPFGLERLGTVITSYLGRCIRIIIFPWLRDSSWILVQK